MFRKTLSRELVDMVTSIAIINKNIRILNLYSMPDEASDIQYLIKIKIYEPRRKIDFR
jgi:hypothetical protein